VTEDEATETLLAWLASAGFSSTSWISGSVQLTMIRCVASAYARLTEYVATLAEWQFNETATGEALTRFSRSRYDNERRAAVAAQHRVVFTCNATSGPYSIAPGALIVTDGTNVFSNVTTVNIPSNGYTTVTMPCDEPGAAGNVGAVGTITQMVTSFAGVTCTNPAVSGTASSLMVAGSDTESDYSLRLRNSVKWGTLATETIAMTVEAIAVASAESITKAGVDDTNPRGDGTVDVYVATDTGAPGSLDVAAALVAVRARFFNSDPRINVVAAPEYELPISGTIYYDSSRSASDVQDYVEESLAQLRAVMPIGGYRYSTGVSGVLRLSDIIQAVENSTGVVYSEMSIGTSLGYIDIPDWNVGVAPSSWPLVYVGITEGA
jgi:uncharacterized phage protein gp47/JayE